MPTATTNGATSGVAFDPDELAKYIARFDIGNPSDAEAANAAKLIRRMMASNGLRFVDAMERADVKQALDRHLQPVREDSAELKEAFAKVTELAEQLTREREISAQLREDLTRQRSSGAAAQQARASPPRPSSGGLVDGWFMATVVMIGLALMIAAAFR
jgi:hypothetical protein